MSLTSSDLDHISALAHLAIKPNEKEQFLGQLNTIINHVNQLSSLPLTDTNSDTDLDPLYRQADIPIQTNIDRSLNAPKMDDSFFSVPKII